MRVGFQVVDVAPRLSSGDDLDEVRDSHSSGSSGPVVYVIGGVWLNGES